MKSKRLLMQMAFWSLVLPFTAQSKSMPLTQNESHPVTLNFSSIDLRQLFQILAEMRGINLILSEKIQGRTNIHMNQVPWQTVLDSVLASKSLAYKLEGRVLWIAPYEELVSFDKRKKDRIQQEDQIIQSEFGLRQIMIEARIVEAERRFAQNLGAKLGYQDPSGQMKMGSQLPANGLNGFGAGTAAISLLGKQASHALPMELSALESSGLGDIISNPRVLAAENSQALIEQGTELPYQSSAGQGATKVQFRKANLRLEVKPRIQKNQMIVLEVDINKDSVGLKTEQGFAIDTKHVKTQVLVESGGTVILGGIFQDMERKDKAKTPFFSEIPFLGALFRQESKTVDKTELLIFLTPTLVSRQKAQ